MDAILESMIFQATDIWDKLVIITHDFAKAESVSECIVSHHIEASTLHILELLFCVLKPDFITFAISVSFHS